jgi:hypothetical protein
MFPSLILFHDPILVIEDGTDASERSVMFYSVETGEEIESIGYIAGHHAGTSFPESDGNEIRLWVKLFDDYREDDCSLCDSKSFTGCVKEKLKEQQLEMTSEFSCENACNATGGVYGNAIIFQQAITVDKTEIVSVNTGAIDCVRI